MGFHWLDNQAVGGVLRIQPATLTHWHQHGSYCILIPHACLERKHQRRFCFFCSSIQAKGYSYYWEADCFPAPVNSTPCARPPPFEAELYLTHAVLSTLLQTLSNTCVSLHCVCSFDPFRFYSASVSIPSHAVYSITVINHALMRAGTKKQGCGASDPAGTCSPTACRMHVHMCAHLLKAAGAEGVLGCFCAEISYLWIIADYSC